MDEKEIKEIFQLLEDAGWQPMLCDTPIPVFESVHAGNPMEPSQIPPDMKLVPKALLSMCPEMMVRVKGDSMIDVGIEDGDMVKVELDATPHEGDIVLVAIGTECTVKSYYVDDDGIPWLVPQNSRKKERYKVIRLDDEQERAYLCGVVREVVKALPRVPCRSMRNLVNEARASYEEESREISMQQVSNAIRIIAPRVKVARRWYSVYRAMVDKSVIVEDDYEKCCQMIAAEVPHHEHLPSEVELQRMAVGSFRKPVSKWNEMNAPVKGKRYKIYKEIAESMLELLEE